MGISGCISECFQCPPPPSSRPQKRGPVPLICAPYPEALVTLHDLLQAKKLEMVDVFKKAGMDGRKIKRDDFIKVIREVSNELLHLCTTASPRREGVKKLMASQTLQTVTAC